MEIPKEQNVPLTPTQKINTVREMMTKSKGQMEKAAPYIMNLDRQMRLALTCFQKNPRLLECHPASLVGAIIQVTQLGLEIDSVTNQVHLVPFNNNKKQRMEVQIIIGYKGLETLAIRTGLVKRITPYVVHEGDDFSYNYGLTPNLHHIPKNTSPNLTHVYTIVHYVNGDKEFRVITKDEIEKRRKRSRAANDGPWVTDYEPMAMKTGMREICKWTPNAAPEAEPLHRAIALDERAEIDKPQDLGLIADPETERPTPDEPTAPPRVEAPPPTKATTEKTLAERWKAIQDEAAKNKVDVKELLKEIGIKEVKNENIARIEATLVEQIDLITSTVGQ